MIGERVERTEDARLLTGASRYIADIKLADAAHAVILRSPHAHAQLRAIDAGPALALDGVVTVLTGADLPATLTPIPIRVPPTHGTLDPYLQLPLARDRVRYMGEPVAVVVAESPYLAEDAAELVAVDYEPLDALVDPLRATDADAPRIHAAGNLVAHWTKNLGSWESARATAALVVEDRFAIQRHTACPMETRGLAAQYDSGRRVLEIHGATKVPHVNRRILAGMLGLPQAMIRMIEPDVGGGFGARGEFYPEDYLIPFLALRLGRPVRWIEDRLEHFVAINHSREQSWRAALALAADGRILGLEARFVNDMGAYVRTHGTVVPSHSAAALPGPYRVPNYRCEAVCVCTNRTPTGTLRAPGMFEANFVRERLVDMAARRLAIDPLELRRRNLIQPQEMPYDVGTESIGRPLVYDSGDFPGLLERAAAGFAALPATPVRDGCRRGVGIATYVEPSGLGPFEGARVSVGPEGLVEIVTGATSQGQGQETTLAQICAATLTVPLERILVRHGDTGLIPFGSGTAASRAAVLAGNAVHVASGKLADKAKATAAQILQVSAADLVLSGGRVHLAGAPERGMTLGEIARVLAPGTAVLLDFPPEHQITDLDGLSVEHYQRNIMAGTHAFVANLIEIEVDEETGLIAPLRALIACDIGRAINPSIVEGQLVGGFVQGLGGALLEDLVYDEKGTLLTGTLADYLLPTVDLVPRIAIILDESSPSPMNPLGIRGVGESGISGAGAAVANALADAFKDRALEPTTLPLTPETVLGLIDRARMHEAAQ